MRASSDMLLGGVQVGRAFSAAASIRLGQTWGVAIGYDRSRLQRCRIGSAWAKPGALPQAIIGRAFSAAGSIRFGQTWGVATGYDRSRLQRCRIDSLRPNLGRCPRL